MKWFFGFSKDTDWYNNYVRYIKCAVNSCRATTTLEPYFIYHGKPDQLTIWLENHGVVVLYTKLSFYDFIKAQDNAKLNHNVAVGAYLRTEIPMLMKNNNLTDEYVLYTDCDVMFLKNFDLSNIKPEYFACASEMNIQDNISFNTGVMLMNIKNLHSTFPTFLTFIKSDNNILTLPAFDQGQYQQFYKGKHTILNPIYNWKPYWGINDDARILHFHGIKVENIEKVLAGDLSHSLSHFIYPKNIEPYRHYFNQAINYEK
jgi:lipopolysaccharide biosynthesis glycosyltransferase